MPELSVIIPIYNVENCLSQCVDSVINQNLDSIEIILVDDGSPDNCPQICDEYKNKYDNIKVIHKSNGGLSSARNAGIRAATGRYIIFMDSDDWWNPNVSVKKMLAEVTENPDVQMFLFTSLDYIDGRGLYKRTEHKRLSNIRTDTVEHYYSDLLANGNLEVSAATKIIKREFLIENKLFFKEGIVCEDSEWILRLLRVLKSVYIINKSLYICRNGREGSITNTVKEKNLIDMLNIIVSSIDYYSNYENSNIVMKYEFCYCAYLWFCALGLCYSSKIKISSELSRLFSKTVSVCKYSNSKKTKLSYNLYKLTGLKFTGFVLGKYLEVKHRFNINKKKQG